MTPDRKLSWLLLASLGSLLAAGSVLERSTPTSDAPSTRRAPLPPPAAMRSPGPATSSSRLIGRGGTLDGTLSALGIEPAQRVALVAAVSRFIDLRQLPAGTGVTVARSASGAAAELTVRHEADRFLRVTLSARDTDGFRIELLRVPTVTSVHAFGGRIESSVAQALAASVEATGLTLAFADIFQWDVDLLTDPRRGDEVRLIYEVRRLGALPDDLPPFGDRADRRGEPLGLGRVLAASYSGERARSHALWVGSGGGIRGGYYDTDGNPLRKSFLKSPLNYRRISSRFSHGRKHPVTRKVVPHHGVDFAAATGTPVVATADGIVIGAGWDGPLGRAVRLRHGSEYVTVYGHLRSIAKGIRTGTAVSQNQVIGYVGSSGRATGPHLHYTVLHRGTAIDPMRMENPPVEPLPPSLAPNLDEARRRWLARLTGIPASG